MNNLGYQGQVGSLNEAEAGALSDNARRVTGVNNAYESDVVGAEAGIQAQYLQNYIQQMNADRNYGLQQDQFGLQQQQYNSGLDQWQKSYDTGNSQWDKTYGTNQEQQKFENELAMQQLEISRRNAASANKAKELTAGERKNSATASFQSWANSAMSQNMPLQDAIAYAYANSDTLSEDGLGIDDAIKYIRNIYTQVRNPTRAAAGGYQPM
jgi:hypothetical protein